MSRHDLPSALQLSAWLAFFVFSLTAALNPTLLAAVTLILTLPSPRRLLLGYQLGAAMTSVTCGPGALFELPGLSTSSTAKHTVSPVIDITLGALIRVIVFVVATGRDRRRGAWSERRRERRGKSRRRSGSAH